jgi:hypothetical protein
MADGTPRPLSALRAGDAIIAASADGTLTTDTVSTLSLADADVQGTTFVVLTTASGRSLSLTPTHHVPVGAACCADLKQAKDVAVGETVYEAVSASAAVSATQVKEIGTATKPGLHSPVLSHGTMPIVNGVATSFDELHNVRLASYNASYGLHCMQNVLTTAPYPSGPPRLLWAAAARGDRAHRDLPRRLPRRPSQVHRLKGGHARSASAAGWEESAEGHRPRYLWPWEFSCASELSQGPRGGPADRRLLGRLIDVRRVPHVLGRSS